MCIKWSSSERVGGTRWRGFTCCLKLQPILAMQMALCKGHVSLLQLETVPPGPVLDLRPLLGHEVLALLPEPLHVIGFSDEEGVR